MQWGGWSWSAWWVSSWLTEREKKLMLKKKIRATGSEAEARCQLQKSAPCYITWQPHSSFAETLFLFHTLNPVDVTHWQVGRKFWDFIRFYDLFLSNATVLRGTRMSLTLFLVMTLASTWIPRTTANLGCCCCAREAASFARCGLSWRGEAGRHVRGSDPSATWRRPESP